MGEEGQGWVGQWEICKHSKNLGLAALVYPDTQVGML